MLDAARRGRAAARQLRRSLLYKNNTDNKGASYGAHENYLMRRATPFGDIVAHLTPFFVSRQVVCGAGRVGIGQDGREHGLPDQPARRLLRGRGRARDHAQAADHQHPRRAARRPGEVPPAARDHRRRQPRRDLDLPQARHDRAGAGDDRGPVHRPSTWRSSSRCARCVPSRTTPRSSTCVTLADGRTLTAVQLQMEYLDQARKYVEDRLRLRRRRADRRRARALGVGADPARDRPDAVRPRARLGRQARAARAVPRPRRARLGRRQAAPGRPAVRRRPARQGPLPPAGAARAAWSGWSPTTRSTPGDAPAAGRHPGLLPRPLPGASTPTGSPPPPGTR